MKTRSTNAMTPEMFESMKNDKKVIFEIAHAVGCHNKDGNLEYYETITNPSFCVTAEQKRTAKKIVKRNHQEELRSIKAGELVLVQMGSDMNQGIPNEFGTFRARGYFRNDAGERFFIELSAGIKKDSLHVDYSIDMQLDELYKQECKEVYEYNKKRLPGFHKPYPKQYQYNARRAYNKVINGVTWEDVLTFINDTYGCSYTSGRLTRWCDITEDDFTSVCAKEYTMEDWQKDGTFEARPGQIVEAAIVEEMRDCVPPIYDGFGILQIGEAYDSDPITLLKRYITFERTANGWKYAGLQAARV